MSDRRTILRGLPAVALAATLPTVTATAQPAGNPVLLRLAARVTRLAAIELRLCFRTAELDDGVVMPPHPEQPASDLEAGVWSDDGRTFTATFARNVHGGTSPEWLAYEAAKEARETECERIREQSGLNAANGRRFAMLARLEAAARDLTAMDCATAAEIGAKAAAWLAIEHGGSEDGWTAALAASIMQDAVRVGSVQS